MGVILLVGGYAELFKVRVTDENSPHNDAKNEEEKRVERDTLGYNWGTFTRTPLFRSIDTPPHIRVHLPGIPFV